MASMPVGSTRRAVRRARAPRGRARARPPIAHAVDCRATTSRPCWLRGPPPPTARATAWWRPQQPRRPFRADDRCTRPARQRACSGRGHAPRAYIRSAGARGTHRRSVPSHGARIEIGEAEHGTHRRGLACAVRTQEAEHLTCGHVEGQMVECGDRAETTTQIVDLEHDCDCTDRSRD